MNQFVPDQNEEIGIRVESATHCFIRVRWFDHQEKRMEMNNRPEDRHSDQQSSRHGSRAEATKLKMRAGDDVTIDRSEGQVTGAQGSGDEANVEMNATENQRLRCWINVETAVENGVGDHCVDEDEVAQREREKVQTTGILPHRFPKKHQQGQKTTDIPHDSNKDQKILTQEFHCVEKNDL